MSRFIKLTSAYSTKENEIIARICVDKIQYYENCVGSPGVPDSSISYIELRDSSGIWVKETPEEIDKLIAEYLAGETSGSTADIKLILHDAHDKTKEISISMDDIKNYGVKNAEGQAVTFLETISGITHHVSEDMGYIADNIIASQTPAETLMYDIKTMLENMEDEIPVELYTVMETMKRLLEIVDKDNIKKRAKKTIRQLRVAGVDIEQ